MTTLAKASPDLLAVGADHGPKFSTELLALLLLLGQKVLPLQKEVPVRWSQVLHSLVELVAHAAGLAVSAVGQLVVDEARRLGIAPLARVLCSSSAAAARCAPDMARELVALHDHVPQFVPYGGDA